MVALGLTTMDRSSWFQRHASLRVVLLGALLTLCPVRQAPAAPAGAANPILDPGGGPLPRFVIEETQLNVLGDGSTPFNLSQLPNVQQLYNVTKRIVLHGVLLPAQQPFDDVWTRFRALRALWINCGAAPGLGGANGSAAGADSSGVRRVSSLGGPAPAPLFGSTAQLDSLKWYLESKEGAALANVSIIACGLTGDYGLLWRDYLSGVQRVNLSHNALTGGLDGLDAFNSICEEYGDDYLDPDCSSANLHILDVSYNALNGSVSSGAVLGDDITDAICSMGCMSMVLQPGVVDARITCMGNLLLYAIGNPGLRTLRRYQVWYASGYVTRDHRNWCFEPSSRWVLPTMWGVFFGMLAATLAASLYVRIALRRLPLRMTRSVADFSMLARGGAGAADAGGGANGTNGVNGAGGGRSLATVSASSGIAYASLPGGAGGGADMELMPLRGAAAAAATAHDERQAMLPKALPLSTLRVPLTGEPGAGTGGYDPNQDGSVSKYAKLPPGRGASLVAGGSAGGSSGALNGSGAGGSSGALLGGGDAGGGGGRAQEWCAFAKRLASRAFDVLCMELRALLVLGMFGLECYWAYSLILYRGGWQLLVLIPNYLENTLGGIAMLRAIMEGTHGRWKIVAAVPLLPFLMSSCYLCYGFLAYPLGLADLTCCNISWEKFLDLMDSCGVLSSTCWAIFSSLAYWDGNSVSTSYQYFNTSIFVGMLLMCFTDLLSTTHHLASTLQIPFKQWLRRELDVRLVVRDAAKPAHVPGAPMAGDSDI